MHFTRLTKVRIIRSRFKMKGLQKCMTNHFKWVNRYDGGPHEASFLKLDCSKVKTTFGWKPVWNARTAMEKIVEWSDCYRKKQDVVGCMQRQVDVFYGSSR